MQINLKANQVCIEQSRIPVWTFMAGMMLMDLSAAIFPKYRR
ncbi:hypothetical Protein YC6258_03726 [Gynuella sunshinyii YC6258]|uniref:Uncharacterized protein n=1 Tax=Gynuella sunshinyii YC6258 TaxID=1445510 RepID=A0A0C5VM42_9GAMM|nr:hypothetical Protein YC6258_03726 [Gynuella sunshinyii YC6258]